MIDYHTGSVCAEYQDTYNTIMKNNYNIIV